MDLGSYMEFVSSFCNRKEILLPVSFLFEQFKKVRKSHYFSFNIQKTILD